MPRGIFARLLELAHEEGDALLEDSVVPPSRRLTPPRRRRSSATRKRGGPCSTHQYMGVPDTRRAYSFNARIATTPVSCRMPTGISSRGHGVLVAGGILLGGKPDR